jgi:hypothetical protein
MLQKIKRLAVKSGSQTKIYVIEIKRVRLYSGRQGSKKKDPE